MTTNERASLAREAAILEELHAEYDAIAVRLQRVFDRGDGQRLGFAIVADLLDWFTQQPLGEVYTTALAKLSKLFARANTAWARDLPMICAEADRLHSVFFARIGPRGTWPDVARIPAELAQALRRACEAETWRFVPILVSDAHALVKRMGGDPERVERFVAAAIAESTGAAS